MQFDSVNNLPPKYRQQAIEKLGIKDSSKPCRKRMGEITIKGPPVAKGRPRLRKDGGTYTPQKTVNAERHIAQAWKAKYKEQLSGALRITICAAFLVPKSKSKKEKECLLDKKYQTSRPDLDNIVKLVLDALNEIAYADDKCICDIRAFKVYDTMEYTYIKIEEL